MKNKSVTRLPENYVEAFHIDLQHDKKSAIFVNVLAGVVMVALLALGFAFPRAEVKLSQLPSSRRFLCFGVLLVSYVAYMVLHEATHGVVMKAFGASRLRFGFTGLYAFAGSEEDYFPKKAYLVIALAPLVTWGVLLAILCALLSAEWFWVAWFLQAVNIGGAMGDVYVFFRLVRKSPELFVKDTGVAMTVYMPQNS